MSELRPYQARAVEWTLDTWARLRAEGRRASVVVQLPTGAGKTPCQRALAEASTGLRCGVMAPGVDLCRQLKARVGCEVHTTTALALRLKEGRALPELDVLLVDEARCITSAGVGPVVDRYLSQGARIALFDATPATAAGMGLGRWAEALHQGPGVKELVAAGHLVPTRVFSAEKGRGLARRPVDVWLELARYGRILKPGERPPPVGGGLSRAALVFCRDKAHAKVTVEEFVREGVPAAFIGDETPDAERRGLLGWTDEEGVFHKGALARGEVWALVCAQLLRQGIDIPEVELILVARAFDSYPLYMQGVGRGGRPCAEIGKQDCIVVDLLGGLVDKHGLPDDPRVWSLEGDAARVSLEPLPPCVKCTQCLKWGRGGACLFCGFVLPPPPPPRVMVRDLVEVRAQESGEEKRATLLRYIEEAYRAAHAKGKRGPEADRSAWSGARRYQGVYGAKPATVDVLRAIAEARRVVGAQGTLINV